MKEFYKNIKLTWNYAKSEKSKIILYAICNLFNIALSIIVPIVSSKIIVSLTNNLLKQVIFMSLILFMLEIMRNVIFYLSSYFSTKVYRETFIRVQSDLGSEILKLENTCLDNNSSGVFIQRLTGDTTKISDIFNILNNYLTNILSDIGIFGAVFIISKEAFFLLVIGVILIAFVENKRSKLYNKKDKEFRKKNEKVSGFVGELVRGVRDIKMLSAEESFMFELNGRIKELNNFRYNMLKTNRNYSFLRGSLNDILDLAMIILLVYLISIKSLQVASALVIHNYMNRVTSIAFYYSGLLDSIKDFNLSCSRIYSIIDSNEFPKEKFGSKHLDNVKGNFEFKNVFFGYNEKPILKGISFKVNSLETVAFVGKSGAGKSTIFSLLCKMYDIDSGNITIDGININELDKSSIRNNITIISQNPYIFNLSIRDNLRLVKNDASEEEIENACKTACLDELINILPDKYDTIVGEGGITLSGGQKQRLAIARALIQKTKIILFDEATSALDNVTQNRIQKAISAMQGDYTILIIAHRLSTVVNADRILFLNDGIIEAKGTHKELLKKNNNYRKLYEAELEK